MVGQTLFMSALPIMMVSSVFSLMMIGHWFLVDPTISRDGMKNTALFSTYLSIGISILVFSGLYESSSSLFNLISTNNWFDLLKNKKIKNINSEIILQPYQTVWITNKLF